MAIVSELVTKIEIKGSLKKLDSYRSGMKTAIAFTAKLGVAVGAVSAILNGLVVATLSGKDSMIQLSRSTDVSVESIQELSFAASQLGSGASAVESTIKSLSLKIGDAAQRGSEDFARLGISVRDVNGEVKTADQVLGEVAKRFKEMNLSLNEQRSLAGSLGIDESLIQLLGTSSSKIRALKNEARSLGIITTEQAKKIVQFNNSFTRLKFGLDSLRQQISIGLAPTLQSLSDKFIGFIAVNKELIQDGISKAIKTFNEFVKLIVKAATWIDTIITSTVGWKVALAALGVVLALTLSPLTLIIAGITLAILIIDDLIVAFKGGNSVIAKFFKDFLGFDIRPVLKGLVEGFIFLFSAIKKILAGVVAVFVGVWKLITGDFDGFIDNFLIAFKLLFSGINDLARGLLQPLIELLDFIFGKAEKVIKITHEEPIQDQINSGKMDSIDDTRDRVEASKKRHEVIQKLANLATVPQAQLAGGVTNNSQASSTVQNNNFTIEVRGDNAQQVALAVSSSLQQQLNTASLQLGKGGR